MNRIRLFAIPILLALTTVATLPAQPTAQSDHAATDSNGVPTVESQFRLITTKLDLTSEQQAKVRPVLQELHDTTEKLVEDQSTPRDDRMAQLRAARLNVDKKLREILTDDQKKKLDALYHEPHPELHGHPNGLTPPPPPQN